MLEKRRSEASLCVASRHIKKHRKIYAIEKFGATHRTPYKNISRKTDAKELFECDSTRRTRPTSDTYSDV